jgi:hypothetical protein
MNMEPGRAFTGPPAGPVVLAAHIIWALPIVNTPSPSMVIEPPAATAKFPVDGTDVVPVTFKSPATSISPPASMFSDPPEPTTKTEPPCSWYIFELYIISPFLDSIVGDYSPTIISKRLK